MLLLMHSTAGTLGYVCRPEKEVAWRETAEPLWTQLRERGREEELESIC